MRKADGETHGPRSPRSRRFVQGYERHEFAIPEISSKLIANRADRLDEVNRVAELGFTELVMDIKLYIQVPYTFVIFGPIYTTLITP